MYIYIYGIIPTGKHGQSGGSGALSFASHLASTRWTQAAVALVGDGGGASTVGDHRTDMSTKTFSNLIIRYL